jgi:hypothetical protein
MNNSVFVSNSKQRINTDDGALPPFETPAAAVGVSGSDIVNPFFEVYLDINDFGVDGAIHFRPIEVQEAEEVQPVEDETADVSDAYDTEPCETSETDDTPQTEDDQCE